MERLGRFFKSGKEAEPKSRVFLVPIKGNVDEIRETMEFASGIARFEHAHINLVHVIEVPRSLALGTEMPEKTNEGEGMIVLAEQIAKELKWELEDKDVSLLEARSAELAILDEAEDKNAEAIIINGNMGHIVSYILGHATCRVIFNRTSKTI